MSHGLRRAYIIHIFCAFLIIAFLVIIPILVLRADAPVQGVEAADEINADPLNRLPATPEEAHQRLLDKKLTIPEQVGGEVEAAFVRRGVRVFMPYNTVNGYTGSAAGTGVKVELVRGAVIETVNITTNADQWFSAEFTANNIQSGDVVKVTDLGGGAAVNVNCTLTGTINPGNNRVTGTAVAGNLIDVFICAPSTYYGDIPPGAAWLSTTAMGGTYAVNFTNDLNLRMGDAAFIYSTDGNNNIVMNVDNPGGSLVVYPQYDDVMGYYLPGQLLTVNAGAATQNVGTAGDGFFEAWFTNYNIVPGDDVSCVMGGNRAIKVRNVQAGMDPAANILGGTAPANVAIRATLDPYGFPIIVETTTDGNGDFLIDLTAAGYTSDGSDVYSITWYDADCDCVVYEFQSFSWYLAEGYTGGDFDTWVLVQNPGLEDAYVTMTFQVQDATAPPYYLAVEAGTRESVHLDELPGLADAQVSTKVTSTNGATIIAERAMYFTYDGKSGGHDSIGTINPCTTWYLPEGYTGGDFDTWVLVQNPGTQDALVTLDFQVQDGTAPSRTFGVAAGTRQSFHLDELENLADAQVSTKVTSDVPVVAERAMYFTYEGKPGGHDSIGVCCPSTLWYLAEGYTGGDFDTWVLVQNPNNVTANVTLEFQLLDGVAPDETFPIPPNERRSIHLDELQGLADAQVSTKVTADIEVVAERAMYFNYNGKQGGHDSRATMEPNDIWYLAEGYTGGDFDTWVLVQNPSGDTATVTLEFQLVDGTAPDHTFTVPAGTRKSILLDELPGLADAEVSTKVIATKPYGNVPVVAERAMYFTYDGKAGGHDSVGVPNIFP
jgi:hypothetical protein